MKSFGWNMLQFSRSVNNLNQDAIDAMKEVVCNYFLEKEGLDACYFCVHRTGAKFEGVQALRTVWSSTENSEAHVVRRYNDNDNDKQSLGSPSLRALAYNENRCLWITSNLTEENGIGKSLNSTNAKDLVDQWHDLVDQDTKKLPPYVSLHDGVCRTLVALPLKHHGEKLGVLVVEFDRQIPITDGARRETLLLQEALGRILWLQDAAQSQKDGTRKALEELKLIVEANTSSMDPPTIFFAFPDQSDSDVTNAVKNVLKNSFKDRIKLISWDEIDKPGQINDQVVNEISRCLYGICYLSEQCGCTETKQIDKRYTDNRNVLIEAGMLHALSCCGLASTDAWIAIREKDDLTEPVPFDFVTTRMIHVPRGSDGVLARNKFDNELSRKMEEMLNCES